ncbi:mCG140694, partial [Mus musculus]
PWAGFPERTRVLDLSGPRETLLRPGFLAVGLGESAVSSPAVGTAARRPWNFPGVPLLSQFCSPVSLNQEPWMVKRRSCSKGSRVAMDTESLHSSQL